MKMTREEANEILEDWNLCHYTPSREAAEAVISALDPLEIISALRPVSREQVEKVFPGCPACKNGPPKLHIPAFRAMAVCNQHMDHEAFDIELNSKFCLNCGRPLTDKAVDMVMERMEELKDAGD